MTKEDFETQLYIRLDDLACNVNTAWCSVALREQEIQDCYDSIKILIKDYFEPEPKELK